MSHKRTIVGIDLGTTYSLVAKLVEGRAVVLPNALGEALTPSAVSLGEDGVVHIGAPARARATTHPERTATAFKRDMGTDRRFSLGSRNMSAPELSALVLGSLHRDAEAALGCKVDEAVVTVPAYFGDLQRQATRDAAAIAGLHVERIINEPTAAALAYGLHERGRSVRAAVLDLGGGTFDVTVLEIVDGVIEIQSSAGDARLGGEDFDAALAELIAERARERLRVDLRSDARGWARTLRACEDAKRRLSSSEETRVVLSDLPISGRASIQLEERVSALDAEAAWAPLLDKLRAPILRALRDASVLPHAIDEVLLVGGSTRMPCVARVASQLFGKLPLRKLPPDEAVAMGAAVQGALKMNDAAVDDLVVTDVAPFTLGIEVMSASGDTHVPGVFAPILERGTVIPASRVRPFFTVQDMQREIRVKVYQGEHSLCRDNVLLGELAVRDLPRAPRGEAGINVRFTYDLNGIIEVETEVLPSGMKKTLVIEKSPGRLGRAELRAARANLERLKLHPRDALPNTTALARADALYVELTGIEREELGMAIAAFRATVERQEQSEIAVLRERLLAIMRSVAQ